ncbi:hypothetical protein FQA47_016185 [Oryzias melastigma]|uniref:Uncharacterized protein n=1 Tax=Oryzias melastigma TaxID=30732 RepID=A0A834L3F8_ORYME|nr:hypothetical protein FQA47_016185 [Oryzias melastigma]
MHAGAPRTRLERTPVMTAAQAPGLPAGCACAEPLSPQNGTFPKLRSYFCGSPRTCPLLSAPLTHDHHAPLLPPGQWHRMSLGHARLGAVPAAQLPFRSWSHRPADRSSSSAAESIK